LAKSFDLKSYARRGAETRLAELNEETQAIYAAFPDLRRGRSTQANRRASAPASTRSRRRNRKPMSAAARKAIGARMKKYWASRRKATK
jgi:hypothetical protein